MRRSTIIGFVLLAAATGSDARRTSEITGIVVVPVADVWSTPSVSVTGKTDDKRETQLLFGERVVVHESSGPWIRINAVEQPEYTHHRRWEGYPGWVAKEALMFGTPENDPNAIVSKAPWSSSDSSGTISVPLGSKLHSNSATFEASGLARYPVTFRTRESLVNAAMQLLLVPYVWGGLSSPPANLPEKALNNLPALTPPKYGVDCSGLVHLAYRVNGLVIPRDSHDQWMKAVPIRRNDLRAGDIIFSASAETPKKITHVTLYAGDSQIVEAPQTGMVVRKIDFVTKYGKQLAAVESGERVGDRILYFGRFLDDR